LKHQSNKLFLHSNILNNENKLYKTRVKNGLFLWNMALQYSQAKNSIYIAITYQNDSASNKKLKEL
jgi:hypothetical protein